MSEKTVSFYQIAKELAEEEQATKKKYNPEREIEEEIRLVIDGKIQDEALFKGYYVTRQRYLEKVFEKAGVLGEYKVTTISKNKGTQEKEFRIPLTQKECVKFLLRQYTKALSRKIRNNTIDSLKMEEAKDFVVSLKKEYIDKHVLEAERERELVNSYVLTELQSRTAFDRVEAMLLRLMNDDLHQIKLRSIPNSTKGLSPDEELRIINDSDAAFLMYYYYHLLEKQSEYWNNVVDMVSELRFGEIEEKLKHPKDDSGSDDGFRDICSVMYKAQILVKQQYQDKKIAKHKMSSEKRMKLVEDILKGRNPD